MSKKGENIYKRKDGRWEARYIKGYHPDGTPKYGYCYGKTYRESKQKVSVAKAALVTGKPAPTVSRKRRFAFYCDEWLKLNRSRVKESTYVKYSGMLEKHIKPRLGGCLVQALTEYAVRLCKTHWCNSPAAFVLTGEANRYIEPRTLQYKLERYTADCDLDGVHFHTLRHTFATRCVEVDFEIKSLSEILGHSSPRITLERYVHSSMELKRDNMNKLTAIGF